MKRSDTYYPVSSSQIVLKELMVPSYENFGGKVHGGVVLSLMDKIAYACAASHSKSYCVTASVDKVDFLNPVEVGDHSKPGNREILQSRGLHLSHLSTSGSN
ncbi:acyl-CoA thioesterase [Marinobacter nauticus]